MSDEFDRERFRRDQADRRPRRNVSGDNGQAQLVKVFAQTAIPTTTGVYYACHPVEVMGTEAEGYATVPGDFTVDTSTTMYVLVIGKNALKVGNFVVARFVDYRWVASQKGPTPRPSPSFSINSTCGNAPPCLIQLLDGSGNPVASNTTALKTTSPTNIVFTNIDLSGVSNGTYTLVVTPQGSQYHWTQTTWTTPIVVGTSTTSGWPGTFFLAIETGYECIQDICCPAAETQIPTYPPYFQPPRPASLTLNDGFGDVAMTYNVASGQYTGTATGRARASGGTTNVCLVFKCAGTGFAQWTVTVQAGCTGTTYAGSATVSSGYTLATSGTVSFTSSQAPYDVYGAGMSFNIHP